VQTVILGTQGLLYTVVIGPDALVAVDRSGHEAWRYSVRKQAGSAVVDASGNVIFGAYTGPESEAPWLISLTPEGADYWHEPMSGFEFVTSLLAGDDEALYVSVPGQRQSTLLALDTVSGQERWSIPMAAPGYLTMSDKGVLYCANAVELMAIQTDSRGLADSPWPKEYRDARNSSAATAPRITAVLDEGSRAQPRETRLLPNYPNPFNSGTVIAFVLEDGEQVDLSIFDLLGQPVRQLVRDRVMPGTHAMFWDGRDEHDLEVSSGLYFYRLSIGRWNQTGNMVKVR
jgi:hypothetical protein